MSMHQVLAYISIVHSVEQECVLGYFEKDDLPEGRPSTVPMVFFFAKGHSIMMHRLNQVASSTHTRKKIFNFPTLCFKHYTVGCMVVFKTFMKLKV